MDIHFLNDLPNAWWGRFPRDASPVLQFANTISLFDFIIEQPLEILGNSGRTGKLKEDGRKGRCPCKKFTARDSHTSLGDWD